MSLRLSLGGEKRQPEIQSLRSQATPYVAWVSGLPKGRGEGEREGEGEGEKRRGRPDTEPSEVCASSETQGQLVG